MVPSVAVASAAVVAAMVTGDGTWVVSATTAIASLMVVAGFGGGGVDVDRGALLVAF